MSSTKNNFGEPRIEKRYRPSGNPGNRKPAPSDYEHIQFKAGGPFDNSEAHSLNRALLWANNQARKVGAGAYDETKAVLGYPEITSPVTRTQMYKEKRRIVNFRKDVAGIEQYRNRDKERTSRAKSMEGRRKGYTKIR